MSTDNDDREWEKGPATRKEFKNDKESFKHYSRNKRAGNISTPKRNVRDRNDK